ncbi:DUF3012 domain-containing protein [Teredinibacter sp. KSP-S5-2]|uniref:DUF3012 domain-containing protein n=1 Tax=Teredinibacter sp. KSP-S5-2 TaxID=3034506 RepID=UPI0029350AEF|nr:DUF3012 domain-containing protein [Teredinibacter sp. KSP-S5-2]WNO07662.1 DUF3012 domain-containing protein [Teredinibacter sp. KSP-S5-2]
MATRIVYIAFASVCLFGCSEKRMSEEWCDSMIDKPNSEWTEQDFTSFSQDCLYNEKKS